MTDDDAINHLRHLDGFTPTRAPTRLEGGLLNEVWRVPGQPASVVVKHAPPHLASDPDVPLDPARIAFEAEALRALGPGGALEGLSTDGVRPPRLLDFDAEASVLVMEDVGEVPDLGAWLRRQPDEAQVVNVGRELGRFIGRLHAATFGREDFARRFNNAAMQATRHAVQYEAIGSLCARAGLDDAEALGAKAEALGERFMEPGVCLVMGDLWPASVLVAPGGLRVVDWELSHYGRPAQDLGHIAAHLWMHAHRAPSAAIAQAVRGLRSAFFVEYEAAVSAAEPHRLLAPAVHRDAALHAGCEVLVRTLGAFQAGFLYDGLSADARPVQEAVHKAAQHLRDPSTALATLVTQKSLFTD